MLWFGIILVAIALLLFFLSKRSTSKAYHVKATDTSKVGNIQKLVGEIASEMPDGEALGFKDYVELKGRVICEEPIRGEISHQMGAIVESQVVRVYERREDTRDSQGHVTTSWRRDEETVSSNRREAPFWIDDGTGRILVKPNRNIELVKAVERFEQSSGGSESGFGGQVSFGSGKLQVSVGGGRYDSNQRTLGFKYSERILPLNRLVYALGEVAYLADEGLVFRQPTEDNKKKPFMLTSRTEEEIVKGTESTARLQQIFGYILGFGGVVLIVYSRIG